jgi:hypothetical protein
VRLGLALGRRGRAAVRTALEKRRRVRARITVAAVDAAGNRSTTRLTRRLR